jgi:uncharacterized repeat protein (TIGR01451 family)
VALVVTPLLTLGAMFAGSGAAVAASPTSTDIVVTARTTAQPLGVAGSIGSNVDGTVGATFRLHAFTTPGAGPQAPIPDAWATCTIVAGGSCTINVPGTNAGGANAGRQFWVVQTSAGASAYANAQFRLGNALGPTDTWFTPGLTQAMVPNTVQNLPRTTATESSGNGASFGAVANSLDNPMLEPQCVAGVRVALVMDLSTSVSSAQRQQFRNAIVGTNGLFDSLTGTNSSVAVFTFGTNSPASGTTNYPVPLALDANRATLENRIQITTSGTQYTNWDRGLRSVADANLANDYDLVLLVTDGAPNYISATNGTGAVQVNGTNVTLRSLEAAVYSANAIKAEGTRILGVGVGNGVSGEVIRNLRAVTGPTANSDYYQTADWSALNAQLRDIAAAATCQVPITVTKEVLNALGQNPTPDNGWTVSATPSAVSAGTATLNPSATSQVTGSGGNAVGQASWNLAFTDPDAAATVTIAEDVASKPGYGFVGGTCTVSRADGSQSQVTMTGPSQALPGITPSDRVQCVLRNQPSTATVVITKQTNEPTSTLFPFASNLPTTGAFTGTTGSSLTAQGMDLASGGTYTVTVPALAAGGTPFSVGEVDIPAGWRADGPPSCSVDTATPGTTAQFNSQPGGVDITRIDAGVTVTCVFRNTDEPVPATAWDTWKWSNPTSGTAAAPAPVLPGSTITYFLYASNKIGGNQPVTDLVLTDDLSGVLPYASLPAGFPGGGTITIQDRSADDPDGSPAQPPVAEQIPVSERGTVDYDQATGTLVWSIPNLDADKRLRLSYTVTVADDAFGSTIVNTLEASGGEVPPENCAEGVGDECATYHETPEPSWTVEKTAVPPPSGVGLGESIEYTVTATNDGPIPIQGAVLTDDLSEVLVDGEITLDEASLAWTTPTGSGTVLGAEPTFDAAAARITGTILTLAPGSSVSMTYRVLIGDHAYDRTMRNAAWGSSSTTPPAECIESEPCVTEHETPGAPRLEIVKVVEPEFGGSAAPTEWMLSAAYAGDPAAPSLSGEGSADGLLWAGVRYDLLETASATVADGWDVKTTWSCEDRTSGEGGGFDLQPEAGAPLTQSRIVLNADADVICTIVNTDLPAELTLVKKVDNGDTGADASASDFTLTATPNGIDGQDAVSGNGDPASAGGVDAVEVFSGAYTLSETGPEGYAPGEWLCTGGDQTGDVVTVPSGGSVTCEIVNTAIAPTLTLVKEVVNGATGGTAEPGDWQLTAEGPVTVAGVTGDDEITGATVPVGDYDLSEGDGPKGYAPTDLRCVDASGAQLAGVSLEAPTVSVPLGGDVTCTFVNTALAPEWTYAKSSVPASGTTVLPGDEITYTLTAVPSAGVPATDVVLTDDLTDVLAHAELVPGSVVASGGIADVVGDELVWTIGTLDEPLTVRYTVTVDADATGVSLRNVVTGAGSVPPGECPDDEPDCRETEHHTPSWTLRKTSDPGTGSIVAPGDEVTYTLTARNTSDVATLHGAIVVDDMADVFAHADLTGALPEDSEMHGTELHWAVPALEPGDEASVSLTVTVHDDAVGVTFRNVATAAGVIPPAPCADDDPTCRETEHHTPTWTLEKTSDPVSGSTVLPGSTVTYTLTARNTSDAATLAGATAVDDLADVLTHATLTEPLAAGLALAGSTLTWTLPELEPGAEASVSYTVTVDADALGESIRNVVTGHGPVPPEPCSDENPDCRETEHVTPEWTLAKSSDPASGTAVRPGTDVVYTLTATNTGPAPVEGAVATDDLSGVLGSATLTEPLATGLSLSGSTLTWAIPTIPAGETMTVSYRVTVGQDTWGQTIRNVVVGEGPVAPTDCAADAPAARAATADPCATEHHVPLWTLEKTSDPASGSLVVPGSTITYTLTAANAGPGAVTGAVVVDDLSEVLRQATLVEPLPAGVTLSGETLTWAVPDIALGGTQSISYSVRVDAGAYGVTLVNVATPGDAGGGCLGTCSTEHRTPPPLPVTGATAPWMIGGLAAALGGIGLAMFLVARRCREEPVA